MSGPLGRSTYGETGALFSVGEPFAAEPSLELVDIRDGEEVAIGGAKAGRFLGLGLRGCGEGREATAVDIMWKCPQISENKENESRVTSVGNGLNPRGVWALNTREEKNERESQRKNRKKKRKIEQDEEIRGKRSKSI